ncbi:MAG: DinB family protein [Candidatus Delongbacteria bacterium]
MSLVETLLPEFEHEMASTRRMLERLPEDKLDWRPHPKSWTLAELATHILSIPLWGGTIFNTESFALPADGGPRNVALTSVAEALERFDANVGALRTALSAQSDEQLRTSWTLSMGERIIFTQPRQQAWRGMILSHLIHHRGQLSVYLRMTDAPLPSIYGPSADERV